MDKLENELYKFYSANEYSLLTLENSEIYCQHYSKYNDPFEFWTKIHRGIPDHNEQPDRFNAALKAWGMEGCDPRDENLESYFEECTDYEHRFEAIRKYTRIACFASEKDNMLMWSHYAEGLRGFCIVLDEQKVLEVEPHSYIANVKYQSTPPVVDSFVYAISSDQEWYAVVADLDDEWEEAVSRMRDIHQKVLAVKPLQWEYENERRLLVSTDLDNKEPKFLRFPASAIKEVILGERMESSFKEKVISIVSSKYPNTLIKTARRADDDYSLIID